MQIYKTSKVMFDIELLKQGSLVGRAGFFGPDDWGAPLGCNEEPRTTKYGASRQASVSGTRCFQGIVYFFGEW